MSLQDKLAIWKITTQPTFGQSDALLRILHYHHPELPLSTRTLVHTPRNVHVDQMHPGLYHHFGFANGIREAIFPFKIEDLKDPIEAVVGIDGVSLSDSSCSKFIPIVAYLPSVDPDFCFEIGVYHGFANPASAHSFLKPFIDEAKSLEINGVEINGRHFNVRIRYFSCDAPMRAWLGDVLSHSSELHGCDKCDGSG